MIRRPFAAILLLLSLLAATARAHPLVENALDVVIYPDHVTIEAHIAREQIQLVQAPNVKPTPDQFPKLAADHAPYIGQHLTITPDNAPAPTPSASSQLLLPLKDSGLVAYHLEYPLKARPQTILLQQSFLREFPNWSASCILRIRTSNHPDYETGLLTASQAYDCDWTAATTQSLSPAPPSTHIDIPSTFWSYLLHGLFHILTGYDHLLFVSALTLATKSFWDLFRVVTAFTLAHTVTLTLSVFNIVTLSEHIVEPMIAASIVFVALQNVFWPAASRGYSRLAVAFAFGLFHGLGFAGGLKEAMTAMPSHALWLALAAFSVGVELGHQTVILPLFAVMRAVNLGHLDRPGVDRTRALSRLGSAAISIAGFYFFCKSLAL